MGRILLVGIAGAVLALASVPSAAIPAPTPMVSAIGILAFAGETPYTTAQRAAISAAIDRSAVTQSAVLANHATPAYSFLYGQGAQTDLAARAHVSTMVDFPALVILGGANDNPLTTLIINQLTTAGMSASAQAVGSFDDAIRLLHSGGGKAYLTSFGPSSNQAVDPVLLLGHLALDLLPKLKANTEATDSFGRMFTDRIFLAMGPEAHEKPAAELNTLLMEDAHVIPLFWLVPR